MNRPTWRFVIALEAVCLFAGAYLYREAFAASRPLTPMLTRSFGKPLKTWTYTAGGHKWRCQGWVFADGWITRCILPKPRGIA